MAKTKSLTGAECVRRNVEKNQARGLMQIKIWVHPDDRDAVRNYAKKKLRRYE